MPPSRIPGSFWRLVALALGVELIVALYITGALRPLSAL